MDAAFWHRYGPWVLLALGVGGLVNTTLLYKPMLRLSQRLLESGTMEKVSKHNPGVRWMRPLLNRALRSPAMWWLGIVQSLVLLVGAALWFAWRP